MGAQLLSVIPVFASTDMDVTARFYAQFGFRQVARHEVGYLILRRDGAELHFNTAPDDLDPALNTNMAYVRVLDIAELGQEMEALDVPDAGVPRCVLPQLRDWGMIEAHSVDPDGNLLIYGAASEPVPKDIPQ